MGLWIVYFDIVDYLGEWLLDLGLMDKFYVDWFVEVLVCLDSCDCVGDFLVVVWDVDMV